MTADLILTIKYMETVSTLIEMNDYELHIFLKKYIIKLKIKYKRSNVGSVFCLSWIITWFSHEMKSFSIVCRLFDFFMVTNKLMPVYLAATVFKTFIKI